LEKPERVQQDAARMMRGQGQVACGERLRELGLFSGVQRRLRAELTAASS